MPAELFFLVCLIGLLYIPVIIGGLLYHTFLFSLPGTLNYSFLYSSFPGMAKDGHSFSHLLLVSFFLSSNLCFFFVASFLGNIRSFFSSPYLVFLFSLRL